MAYFRFFASVGQFLGKILTQLLKAFLWAMRKGGPFTQGVTISFLTFTVVNANWIPNPVLATALGAITLKSACGLVSLIAFCYAVWVPIHRLTKK